MPYPFSYLAVLTMLKAMRKPCINTITDRTAAPIADTITANFAISVAAVVPIADKSTPSAAARAEAVIRAVAAITLLPYFFATFKSFLAFSFQ